jgi:hypothetical protein
MAVAMLTRDALRAALARMESSLADSRRNLALAESAAYRRVLDELLAAVGPDLDRLRRRIDRQEAAIEALRRKYGVNEARPSSPVW